MSRLSASVLYYTQTASRMWPLAQTDQRCALVGGVGVLLGKRVDKIVRGCSVLCLAAVKMIATVVVVEVSTSCMGLLSMYIFSIGVFFL